MAITLDSVTNNVVLLPPRIILLGVEKIGKSSFAAGADNPIFIPISLEEGIDDLKVAKFPTCAKFDDVVECLEVLADSDHNYKTVVIDSGSTLEVLIWKSVCEDFNVRGIEQVGGGYGKGYTEALAKWQKIMKLLDYLRKVKHMATIVIGHVKVKRFDDPDRASYDQWQFDIHEKASSLLLRWSDCILFANIMIDVNVEDAGFNKKKIKAVDLDVGNRYLYTTKTPSHPGGGRGVYGQLPAEIPLDWSAFQEAVAEAIKESKKK